ncbi:MAG: hypothetical protein K6F99_11745 [Lachnospiraceae bacterium]|nr:hypothetical protein [Lachnospiraceae bacterium]
MYLSFTCVDVNGEINREICSFQGIRFNINGFAVLSTEHNVHDYILPIDNEHYTVLINNLENLIKTGPSIIRLAKGKVYRVRKNAMLPLDDKKEREYEFTGI